MKGTPVFPQCGFSAAWCRSSHLGVKFKGVNVLDRPELREGIKAFSNWPTIPQLYVKGEFVGGCDIVREMFQSGELKMLQNPLCGVDDRRVGGGTLMLQGDGQQAGHAKSDDCILKAGLVDRIRHGKAVRQCPLRHLENQFELKPSCHRPLPYLSTECSCAPDSKASLRGCLDFVASS
jgi:monothiol glutaredoxin